LIEFYHNMVESDYNYTDIRFNNLKLKVTKKLIF
jgi:hypothetical protein